MFTFERPSVDAMKALAEALNAMAALQAEDGDEDGEAEDDEEN